MRPCARPVLAIAVALVVGLSGCASDDADPAVDGTATTGADLGALRVPADFGTIQEAVDAAEPGDLVLVAAGEYAEEVHITTPRIVVRGEDRTGTALDGDGELGNAFLVEADGVAIENLTIREYENNGVLWTGVEGYRGSYLTLYRLGAYGLYALDSEDGRFEHSYGSGAADSAFYVGQCEPCDVVIDDVVGELSAAGYSGTNSNGGVYVVRSQFRNNRVGIALATYVEGDRLQRDTTVAGNVVTGSGDLAAPTVFEGAVDAGTGVGILVPGGTENRILRNRIDASATVGVGLAPNPADDSLPRARGNEVRENVVTGSGIVDLGVLLAEPGDGNCFAANSFTTSGPADIEAAMPCEGAPTADPAVGALDLAQFLVDQPANDDWMGTPEVPPQPNMPDAASAPPEPAVGVGRPPEVDAIPLPG